MLCAKSLAQTTLGVVFTPIRGSERFEEEGRRVRRDLDPE